jgi:hypothetical protein
MRIQPIEGCLILVILFSLHAMAQDSLPKYSLGDTTIYKGDNISFQPRTWQGCLETYDSRYEVAKDSLLDSVPRFIILITSRKHPSCPLIYGYAGPNLGFNNLPVGVHRLRFTDSSDFKLEIPDRVKIRVIERPTAIVRRAEKIFYWTVFQSFLRQYNAKGQALNPVKSRNVLIP